MRENYEYGGGSDDGDAEDHRVEYLKSCHMEEEERTKNYGLMVLEGSL